MATIKPYLDVNCIYPESEREIYQKFLALDPIKTKDWVIYYSFYFKRKENKFSSYNTYINQNNEIDFLVLAPKVGIFVLEVKGGLIKVEDGIIYQYNRNKQTYNETNPYVQGKHNFYSLKDIIQINKNIVLDKYPYATLVAFPDISTKPNVGPISNGHDTFIGNMDLYSFIMENANYTKRVDNSLPLTLDDVKIIEKELEGANFIYSKNKNDYIDSVNLSITNLTEEQKKVLEGLLENERCLINGKAGTGKTVLCQFLYNKLTEKKKSVIYFSFNRLIANFVSNSKNGNNSSGCFPIIDYLEREYINLTKKEIPPSMTFDEKRDFLFKNMGQLIANDLNAKKYDCLIIDEAQDIIGSDDSILYFDNLLNGGLSNGMCYIFYDSKQAIFSNKDKKIYDRDEFAEYRYAKFRLNRNCRNSMSVDEISTTILNKSISKLDSSIFNKNSHDIYFKTIFESEEGANVIIEDIEKLLSEKNKMNQITLLFNYNEKNSNNLIIKYLKAHYKDKLNEYSINSKTLTYSTISSFKGMENDVIFYINDNANTSYNSHYVGISRAKALVYVYKVK